MLQLLVGNRTDLDRAVGLDTSHSMLAVARANLERGEVRGIELRQGDVYSPPVEPGFDLVVIHQVLHFLEDPARAIREARRLLNPGGRLLLVDFAPHSLEFLRADHAHRRLGFRADVVTGWMKQCGLTPSAPRLIAPDDEPSTATVDDERLVVTLWLGRDRPAVVEPIPPEERVHEQPASAPDAAPAAANRPSPNPTESTP